MIRVPLLGVALTLLVPAVGLFPGGVCAQHQAHVAMARSAVGKPVPEAQLLDQDGRGFALGELRGKAALVSFIYTSCHHVCPLIVESVAEVRGQIRAKELHDIRFIFLTVDPEIDTPPVLGAYARRRSHELPGAVFLTGTEAELRAVWEAFGVKVTKLGRGLVDHPPASFLLDTRGVIHTRYLGSVLDAAAVAGDLRAVLQTRER